MSTANVSSLDALRHLRSGLVEFSDATGETMIGLDMELRRGLQWVLEEQPRFWKNEIRRLQDRVQEAKLELQHCRSLALPGEVAPCSEQKHALERAILQLRHAEEKAKITKHWGQLIEHEGHEWQGRANQFTSTLEGVLPRAIALLDRSIAALEAYAAVPQTGLTAAEGSQEKPSEFKTSPQPADEVTDASR